MRHLFSCLILAAAFAATAREAVATPVYRETFLSARGSDGNEAAPASGWKALVSGHTLSKIGNLKVFPPGAPDSELGPISSSPQGTESRHAFWGKPVDKGLLIFTDEFKLPAAALASVRYRHRVSDDCPVSDESRLALLVGRTWYISDRAVTPEKPGGWEWAQFPEDSEPLTFGTSTPAAGVGPAAPRNAGKLLPTGAQIRGFGVFFPRVCDRVRIDTFTVENNSDRPEPASDPLPDDSDRPGYAGPSDAVDGSVDAGSKPGAGPTAGDGAGSTYRLCGAAARSTRVRVASRDRAKLLAVIRGPGVTPMRDKALAALVVADLFPANVLVNLRAREVSLVRGRIVMKLDGWRRGVRLGLDETRIFRRYLDRSGATTDAGAPVFRGVTKNGSALDDRALCLSEILGIVKRRAKQAGLGAETIRIITTRSGRR